MENKECRTCHEFKEKTEINFGLHHVSKDGFRSECKECRNQKLVHHWNEDKTKLKCIRCDEYKNENEFDTNTNAPHRNNLDRRCKVCKAEATKNRREQRYNQDPLRRILVERISGAKTRSAKNNNIVEITIDDLFTIFHNQNGKCAISGIELTYTMLHGRVPTNISLDQIVPSRGYTVDNVQLVCMAVNQMKSDLSNDELLMFCNAIAENAREWAKKHKEEKAMQKG